MPLQRRGGQPSEGFEAQWPGTCWVCEGRIKPGDQIDVSSAGGYRHVDCPEDVDERPTRFQGTFLDEMGY